MSDDLPKAQELPTMKREDIVKFISLHSSAKDEILNIKGTKTPSENARIKYHSLCVEAGKTQLEAHDAEEDNARNYEILINHKQHFLLMFTLQGEINRLGREGKEPSEDLAALINRLSDVPEGGSTDLTG